MPPLVRYCLLPENPELFLKAYLPLLPEASQEKIRSYAAPQERALRLAGKLLLQKTAAEISGNAAALIDLEHLPGQKPRFKNLPLHFSIAHSGKMSAVAMSDEQPLGLDIEGLRPLDWQHFTNWLHENEKVALHCSLTPSRHFLQIWTHKEAILKATGSGINADFAALDTTQNPALYENQLFYWQPLHLHPAYVATVAALVRFPAIAIEEVFF